MRKLLLIFLFTCACVFTQAQINIITTICGDDTAGYNGDNLLAKNARLHTPAGIALNKYGVIYIADGLNHRVRSINLKTSIITTIAGTGTGYFSGDGGPATNATLFAPTAVFIDTSDNIYIADGGNNRIRKISAQTGIITTVAGSGPTGVGAGSAIGDGGFATNAQLNVPNGLCLDYSGNIYIADYGNNKIRKIDFVTGIITTVAGNGSTLYVGEGMPATAEGISGAIDVYADNYNNIFYSDQYNHSVRKIDAISGTVTTIAGTGTGGYSGDNGPATMAKLGEPGGLYVDEHENVFIVCYANGVIRKVNGMTGIITTVAGKIERGFSGDGGPATDAQLRCNNLALDSYGTMYIADMDNNRIRMVLDTTLHVNGVASITKPDIKIYPNPASNELTIEGAVGSEVSVRNMVGQEVLHMDKIKATELINISRLAQGMYVVSVVNAATGERTTRKIVKAE